MIIGAVLLIGVAVYLYIRWKAKKKAEKEAEKSASTTTTSQREMGTTTVTAVEAKTPILSNEVDKRRFAVFQRFRQDGAPKERRFLKTLAFRR